MDDVDEIENTLGKKPKHKFVSDYKPSSEEEGVNRYKNIIKSINREVAYSDYGSHK